MLMHDMSFGSASHGERRLRALAAATLHAAGRLLDRLATRLVAQEHPDAAAQVLEFYADAAAPEGALYLNGRLVGRLQGVTRL